MGCAVNGSGLRHCILSKLASIHDETSQAYPTGFSVMQVLKLRGNKRSLVHVDDVVQAALLAAEKPEAAGKIYIVTDGCLESAGKSRRWHRHSSGPTLHV